MVFAVDWKYFSFDRTYSGLSEFSYNFQCEDSWNTTFKCDFFKF